MSAWQTLSKIDCSKHTEKKGNLTYLSWAWAWATLMEHYPESLFEIHDNQMHDDGTVTVSCTVTVEAMPRTMWLPVMDNRNNAVKNPDARKLSDAKMRCLVKAIAMHGLGLYIYAGEDLPMGDDDDNHGANPAGITPSNQTIGTDEFNELNRMLDDTGSDKVAFCAAFNVQSIAALPMAQYARAVSMLNRKKAQQEKAQ